MEGRKLSDKGRERLYRLQTALQRTLQTTGVSIIINALSMGLGFVALLLAAVRYVQILGGLLGLSVVVSTVYTLTILSVLLLTTRPRLYNESLERRIA